VLSIGYSTTSEVSFNVTVKTYQCNGNIDASRKSYI